MQNKKQLLVKNLHRVGKYSFESEYGEVEVEIRRLKGMENYYICIDGRSTGMCRGDCESAYLLAGEYLGIEIIEGESNDK